MFWSARTQTETILVLSLSVFRLPLSSLLFYSPSFSPLSPSSLCLHNFFWLFTKQILKYLINTFPALIYSWVRVFILCNLWTVFIFYLVAINIVIVPFHKKNCRPIKLWTFFWILFLPIIKNTDVFYNNFTTTSMVVL